MREKLVEHNKNTPFLSHFVWYAKVPYYYDIETKMLRALRSRAARSGVGAVRRYGSIRHNAALSVDLAERRDRKTTIICTVGPSSWHRDGLRSLLLRGHERDAA